MIVKFNNSENFIHIRRCSVTQNTVKLIDENLVWDLGGFKLYDDKKKLIRDCSDYNYKWNIHTEYQYGVILTNSETDREREINPNDPEPIEVIDPLSAEELTSCVADLLYETSLMKLGLEVE